MNFPLDLTDLQVLCIALLGLLALLAVFQWLDRIMWQHFIAPMFVAASAIERSEEQKAAARAAYEAAGRDALERIKREMGP